MSDIASRRGACGHGVGGWPALPRLALEEQPNSLLAFSGNERIDESLAAIPISFVNYLALADRTGWPIRDDKRGFIPEELTPILTSLGIDEVAWVETVRAYGPRFSRAVGPVERLRRLAQRLGQKWLKGWKPSCALYATIPQLVCPTVLDEVSSGIASDSGFAYPVRHPGFCFLRSGGAIAFVVESLLRQQPGVAINRSGHATRKIGWPFRSHL